VHHWYYQNQRQSPKDANYLPGLNLLPHTLVCYQSAALITRHRPEILEFDEAERAGKKISFMMTIDYTKDTKEHSGYRRALPDVSKDLLACEHMLLFPTPSLRPPPPRHRPTFAIPHSYE
jgi:hypothetical protein